MLVGLLVLALLTASGAGAAPFAYITNRNSDNVTVIDGTTVLVPPGNVDVPPAIRVGPQPAGVAVNRAGTRAYVANSNVFGTGVPSLSVIDTATLTVLTTVTLTGWPSGVAVSADGSVVYVANSDNGTVAPATSHWRRVSVRSASSATSFCAVTSELERRSRISYSTNERCR